MSLKILKNKDLQGFNTLRLKSIANFFTELTDKRDIPELFSYIETHSYSFEILGQGSNTILSKDFYENCVFIINKIPGIEIIDENDSYADVRIGAGVIWDKAVQFAVDNQLQGIEALSGIPGCSGATPVQNVGAYGQEIKDTILSVEVYNIEAKQFETLNASTCNFSYRSSIFKTSAKKTYIITSIVLRLHKLIEIQIPEYKDTIQYFAENQDLPVTLETIRKAILHIRSGKLPDPAQLPNVGSFFKNPLVESSKFKSLAVNYPDMPSFLASNGLYKLNAAWLIDNAGLKGYQKGNFQVSSKHALVIIHNGEGSVDELTQFVEYIQDIVLQKYGILLEPEPIRI